MKTRQSIAGLVIAALVFGVAGLAVAAETVPGAVYGGANAGYNKPVTKVAEDLQKAGVKDVKADHWAAGSLSVLVEAGLILPDTSGQLKPDATMSTEQGVSVFAKVLGIASKTDDDATALQKAQQAGIAASDTNGKDDFSRADVARLIATALGVSPKNVTGPDNYPFADYATTDPSVRGILAALYELGIFKGYEDKTFRPDGILTKAEMAILIDRILGGLQ